MSFNIAIPTTDIYMNKADMRLISALLIISKRNISDPELDRYVYLNDLFDNKKSLTDILGLSSRTIITNINKMIKNEILEVRAVDGQDVLIIKIEKGKGFVLIDDVKLERILKICKQNEFKLYLVIKYMYDSNKSNKVKLEKKWLCKKIGLSENSVKSVTVSLKNLERKQLIKIEKGLIKELTIKDKILGKKTKKTNFYSVK